MNTWRRAAAMLQGMLAILGISLGARANEPQPGLDARGLITAHIAPLVAKEVINAAAVGVVYRGQVERHYFGQIVKDGPLPVGDTLFEIGSITKVFTGILLAQMVAEGTVKLDTPVQELLPEGVRMPQKGRAITLLDLAAHRSGLPRLPGNMHPADNANPYVDYTVQAMYDFLNSCELAREPGEAYEYSNLAVGLLGHVLALKAGESYEDLVKRRICGPLGMGNTTITLSEAQQGQLAPGHAPPGFCLFRCAPVPVKNWDIPTLAGAGALRSTLNDMLLFLQANMQPGGTPIAGVAEAAQEAQFTVDPATRVGFNWHLSSQGAERPPMIWHNGGTGGYHAFLGFYRESQCGIVLLVNNQAEVDAAAITILNELEKLPITGPAPEAN